MVRSAAPRRDRVELLQQVVAPDADRLAMDQELVARAQRLVAEGVETSRAGCGVGRGARVEIARRELQPQQSEVELRGGPPERGGDLLDDLLLQRRLCLLDVEALSQPIEVRALVAAVLQLADERLPRRAPHRVSNSTPPTESRVDAQAWLLSRLRSPPAVP